MPVPHNYHDRGIHGPMYHDHGPLHSHHYLPHPHTYHVPPCPPPHPHVDICVPYDDTALWMAIERLQQELDEEIQARKDADDVLQAEIDDLQDQIDHLQDEIDDLQDQIDDIDDEIEDIYKALEDMLSESTSSKTLHIDDGDYTITWYNGYKIADDSPNEEIHVQRKQTTLKSKKKKYTTTTIIVSANANYYLTNSRSLSQSSQPSSVNNYPMFRHASEINDSSDERSMYSRICRITLLDDYGNCTATDDSSARVWNMSPSSKRASWDVNPYISSITNGSHNALLIGATQISDGYNTQYYTAYSPTLTYGLLNLHVEATYNKSEDL